MHGIEKSNRNKDNIAHAVGPKLWLCQLAVALTQAGMVVGSVYLKGSLEWVDESKKEVFHPIVFAFAREASAAPILYALSVAYGGYSVPHRRDIVRVASLGAFMFTAHIMYIIGIELSGVIVASCMQPAIPVFTVLMGILLQMETANPQKLSGISLAVAGAICMVRLNEGSSGKISNSAAQFLFSIVWLGIRVCKPCVCGHAGDWWCSSVP